MTLEHLGTAAPRRNRTPYARKRRKLGLVGVRICQPRVQGPACATAQRRCEWLDADGFTSRCAYYGTADVLESGRDPECFTETVPDRDWEERST